MTEPRLGEAPAPDAPGAIRKRPVTLSDVAALAGVSKMTVSLILGASPSGARISAGTRSRVQNAARQLHYYPSAVAKGLTRRRMNTIGVVLSQQFTSLLNDPYVCSVLDGIMAAGTASRQNTTVFTGQVWSDAEHSLPIFCDGRCDGLILISPPTNSDVVQALLEAQVPFVLIHQTDADERVSSVTIDNVAPMDQIVSHLIEQGHRRIAFLGGAPESWSANERFYGFKNALDRAGIEYDSSLVSRDSYERGVGYARARHLLALPQQARPTALCCASDRVAIDAVAAIKEAGLRVPGDLSVTGFDDIPDAIAMTPPLTTVRQPMRLLGERAAELLLEEIDKGCCTGRNQILPTETIFRSSVASAQRS